MVNLTKVKNVSEIAKEKAAAGGLVYPIDIGGMSRSAHYVQFFMNEQTDAKAYFNGGAVPNGEATKGSVPRAPTVRTLGSITLYMPNQISVSQKANYGEAEMGLLVAAGLGSYKGMVGGASNIDMGVLGSTLAKEAKNKTAAALEGAGATGAKAAKAIMSGETTNNRTEMKFEGIDRRSFQFTFRLIPRSSAEAEMIEQIVQTFREHSMPSFTTGDSLGRTLKAPSTFDIQYHPSEHLHAIGTSVLEAVDVKFGGDRPQFFGDKQPAETELTMTFKELDIVTREKVARGF